MRKQFRSQDIDKLAQKSHRHTKRFPELDNLRLIDIEVHGFPVEEEEEWKKLEKMLRGGRDDR